MSFARLIPALFILALLPPPGEPGQDRGLVGFRETQAQGQRQLEARFDTFLRASNLEAWMKRLSARPQHLGSPYRKENAEFILAQFKAWGYDARIETFEIYYPTPKVRRLEMTEPVPYAAILTEPPLKGDPVTEMKSESLPSFNAYSPDGEVTAELVYVNQGIPRDYEELARRGISVRGKIVIARYGGCYRGVKPKVAAQHGAIGCLIYSDPLDGGYGQGDVTPEGAYRDGFGVERGSVLDITVAPGDPLTPGTGATKEAKRLAVRDAKVLAPIPTLPIGYNDALPLLKELKGRVAPESWRGALPITYHLGPGPCKVHLKLEFDWKLVPAYDVVAFLKGRERADEWIIRGNHADGWVAGASDPLSGLVSMMEEARAVGELVKTGWRPDRTLVYCAWDAEEPGIIGSTEWVEEHAAELKEKAAVYINTDSNGRGFLSAGGSASLERLVNQAAGDVRDPQTGVSVVERAAARSLTRGGAAGLGPQEFHLSALGSGSDFSPFYQHLGISSLNLSFGGEGRGGVGHSIYDTFAYFTRFIDPGFQYGVALAKTSGRIVLRLAEADIVPFEFTAFSAAMKRYVKEVTELAGQMRADTERENRLIDQGAFKVAADPLEKLRLPEKKEPVPGLDFSALEKALAKIDDAALRYGQAIGAFPRSGRSMTTETKKDLDRILYQAERALTREEGLARRPWFKHYIDAPGYYTGYSVKTIPGVREALEDRNWAEAQRQIPIAADVLSRFAAEIDKAAAAFEGRVK